MIDGVVDFRFLYLVFKKFCIFAVSLSIAGVDDNWNRFQVSLSNEAFEVPSRSAICFTRPPPWQVCTVTWPAGYGKLGVQ